MVNGEGTILHKTSHDRGRIHDYEIFKNKHPITPLQVENVFDLGYMGVQNDFPTVKSVLPVRKKKNVVLSGEERTYNRKHSQFGMMVEHTIPYAINWIYKNTDGSNKWTATDNGKKWVEKILQYNKER